ncbi:MAG: YbaY family lipoprotein [Ginsengibacter sp.]
MSTDSVINGKITFEEKASSFIGATLHVYLEDVSMADAASVIVGRYVEKKVNFNGETSGFLSFKINYKDLDSGNRYEIRVHIDVNGDGGVSKGDYINVQSYPVITQGYPTDISIRLQQVT